MEFPTEIKSTKLLGLKIHSKVRVKEFQLRIDKNSEFNYHAGYSFVPKLKMNDNQFLNIRKSKWNDMAIEIVLMNIFLLFLKNDIKLYGFVDHDYILGMNWRKRKSVRLEGVRPNNGYTIFQKVLFASIVKVQKEALSNQNIEAVSEVLWNHYVGRRSQTEPGRIFIVKLLNDYSSESHEFRLGISKRGVGLELHYTFEFSERTKNSLVKDFNQLSSFVEELKSENELFSMAFDIMGDEVLAELEVRESEYHA